MCKQKENKEIITKIEGKCVVKDCEKDAVMMVSGFCNKEPKLFCKEHGEKELDTGAPAYQVECPNCNCEFGVG